MGAFGRVLKGVSLMSGHPVAIKVLDKGRVDPIEFEQVMVEVDILRAMRSPYVVKYLDYFESSKQIYIVQEYLEGTNMVQYLRSGPRPEEVTRDLFLHLA